MQKAETTQIANRQKRHLKGIVGSTLKHIAMFSMLLDHVGAILLDRMLIQRGLMEVIDQQTFQVFLETNAGVYYTHQILRLAGRIAFPIFCFLLVQGFLHTHNLKKYLGRLFLFALISEVPFDVALSGKLFDWNYQNIYFTLFLGILTLAGIRMAEGKNEWHIAWRVLFGLLCAGLGAGTAALLGTDYGLLGVLAIVALYFLREKKTLSMGASCTVLCFSALTEIFAFVSLLPVYLYNGKKGSNIKWLFYLFYPVHILLLYLLACGLGLGHIIMG